MKIAVLFQIYLPYILPRTPDWYAAPYLQLMFNVGGHEVSVHPRQPDEPLFPNKLDKDLSAEVLTHPPVTPPVADSPASVAVKDYCYDRLEVVVFGELESADEVLKEEVRLEYIHAAAQAGNQFLAHCRVAAHDADIRGIEWHFSFSQKAYFLIPPYSYVWCSEKDNQLEAVLTDSSGERLEGYSCGSVAVPHRRPVSIADVAASLAAGRAPDLPTSLLVSAQGHIETEGLREGVIALASACEVAGEEYLRRKGAGGDRQVARILKGSDSFAAKRFHLIPTHVEGRSLKTEDPPTFDLVEKMYKTRNTLAHEGLLAYRGPGRVLVPVDRAMVNEFWRACEKALDWVAAL